MIVCPKMYISLMLFNSLIFYSLLVNWKFKEKRDFLRSCSVGARGGTRGSSFRWEKAVGMFHDTAAVKTMKPCPNCRDLVLYIKNGIQTSLFYNWHNEPDSTERSDRMRVDTVPYFDGALCQRTKSTLFSENKILGGCMSGYYMSSPNIYCGSIIKKPMSQY